MAHWANEALALARDRGLLRGDPDGAMRPDATVTRAELALVANRLYEAALSAAPATYQPDYERYGWRVTPATHSRAKPVRYLVVHHEGGTAEGSSALAIHRYHVKARAEGGRGWAGIGYHACVEPDGRIAEGRPTWAVGAHAKGYNHESLGLCLVGNYELWQPTETMIESAAAWLRWQKAIWPQAEVVGHNELPGMATDCPGRFIDMDALRARTKIL